MSLLEDEVDHLSDLIGSRHFAIDFGSEKVHKDGNKISSNTPCSECGGGGGLAGALGGLSSSSPRARRRARPGSSDRWEFAQFAPARSKTLADS